MTDEEENNNIEVHELKQIIIKHAEQEDAARHKTFEITVIDDDIERAVQIAKEFHKLLK